MDVYSLYCYSDECWDFPRDVATDTACDHKRLGEILLDAGVLSEVQLQMALEQWDPSKHRHLGQILLDLELIGEETLARALATQFEIPYVDLNEIAVSGTAVGLVDGRLATLHRALPVFHTERVVIVAMADPSNIVAMDEIARFTGLRVKPVIATASDIDAAIGRVYGWSHGRPGGYAQSFARSQP